MEEQNVTDEEFSAIQSAFLDQVIVGDNIFFKSSPKEVERFIKFVSNNGPFDVVIDGLNMLYLNSPGNPQLDTLLSIESFYHKKGKRILVLGNMFMRHKKDALKPTTSLYLAATSRADDAFFLYAALSSSKDTLIVTRDKLRDHQARLKAELKPLFHHWLKSVQVSNISYSKKTGQLRLARRNFNLGPVEDPGGWHIPINDADIHAPFGRNGIFCLRRGQDRNRDKKTLKYDNTNTSHHKQTRRRKSVPWYEE